MNENRPIKTFVLKNAQSKFTMWAQYRGVSRRARHSELSGLHQHEVGIRASPTEPDLQDIPYP